MRPLDTTYRIDTQTGRTVRVSHAERYAEIVSLVRDVAIRGMARDPAFDHVDHDTWVQHVSEMSTHELEQIATNFSATFSRSRFAVIGHELATRKPDMWYWSGEDLLLNPSTFGELIVSPTPDADNDWWQM